MTLRSVRMTQANLQVNMGQRHVRTLVGGRVGREWTGDVGHLQRGQIMGSYENQRKEVDFTLRVVRRYGRI